MLRTGDRFQRVWTDQPTSPDTRRISDGVLWANLQKGRKGWVALPKAPEA
jgi:hypothetical protein